VPARLRLVLIGAAACLSAVLAAIALAGLTEGSPPASSSEGLQLGPTGFAGSVRPPGARAPALTRLRDERGRPAGSLPAGPVVFTFLYATCDDTCPIQVQQIRGALDDLGRDVPVIGVSVDPASDTPDRARRFMTEQAMTGRMRFLLGNAAALEPVWRAFGIAPQIEGHDHSAYVVVVDRQGRQRVGFPASALTPEALRHDLEKLGA